MRELTAVSLFAGIGGFDLALERNGVHVTTAVEIDKHARGILARHFPNTVLRNDVTKVTADDLRADGFVPERGILTGGFPCQDLSVAGRRAGMGEGTRSGLFWHIVRILADLHPRWVVLENVPGLLSSNGGRDMGAVLGSLADLGYGLAYRVLDAQFFGVPQRRRRVIIVGCLGDAARPAQILLEPEGRSRDLEAGHTPGSEVAADLGFGVAIRGTGGGVAQTLTARDSKGLLPDRSLGTAVVEVVSTLQAAGGSRGYRTDAESAGGASVGRPERRERSRRAEQEPTTPKPSKDNWVVTND